LDVVGVKTIIMPSSPYLLLWNTDLCGNSAYTCMCAFLNNTKNITFPVMPLLLVFCICSRKETVSITFCMQCKTCFNVELHGLENTASIPLQCLYHFHYKLHISIFLMCKCERHFTNTFEQQIAITPVKYNNQTE